MKLNIIFDIQQKCHGEDAKTYTQDMVEFYDFLEAIHMHFNYLDDGVTFTRGNLNPKLIPMLDQYLNMFCGSVKGPRFEITHINATIANAAPKILVKLIPQDGQDKNLKAQEQESKKE